MRGIVIRWLILSGSILVAAYLIDGIEVGGFLSALGAAAMLGVLNALFRPILLLVTLPINILTFGLFTFFINALLLKMVAGVIPGFEVRGFLAALFGSLVISVVSGACNFLINDGGKIEVIELRPRGKNRWE